MENKMENGNRKVNCLPSRMEDPRGSQSIKIDIGKSFDKSISIDKLILNDIDSIDQSIKSMLTCQRSDNFIDFIGFIDRY